jgi:hypothetical protein
VKALLNKKSLSLLSFLFFLFASTVVFSYPDQEKAQLSSLTGITSQATQMALSSDNQYLYLGFSDKIRVVDMGTFDVAAAALQPYDISADSDYDRVVGGVGLTSDRLYVSQVDGYLLYWGLSSITSEPTQAQLDSGNDLGKIAINSAGTRVYILDTTDNDLVIFDVTAGTFTTIDLTYDTTFNVRDITYVENAGGGTTDYIYVSTDKGIVFRLSDGSTAVSSSQIDTDGDTLPAIRSMQGASSIYVVDSTDSALLVMEPTTFTVSKTVSIEIDPDTSTFNSGLESVLSSNFNAATDTYTYLSGVKGLSVLDSNENLIDITTGTDVYEYDPIVLTNDCVGPMVGSTDQYVYVSCSGGNISVVTDRPYITIVSVTYSGGGSSMSTGESVAIVFQTDEAGAYTAYGGGTIAKDGTILKDATNTNITGTAAASTDTTITVPYDNNSTVLDEGDNYVYIFLTATAGGLEGRGATTVKVDTPPPQVTVTGTGFGNTRMYVYITRLDISDINYYNVYVSTNTTDVDNRTVTPTRFNQPSSGSTVTAEVGGLTNNTLYYGSVEAVDDAGNVGTLQTRLSDGTTRISATPRETGGPANLMGEKGCSLVVGSDGGWIGFLFVAGLLFVMIFVKRRVIASPLRRTKQSSYFPWIASFTLFIRNDVKKKLVRNDRRVLIVIFSLILFSMFLPTISHAEEATPQWWSTELQGGFWMPTNSTMKRFFDPCCNLIGRIEQGFLYDSKYGVGLGIGFLSLNGDAVSVTTPSLVSQDTFNLFIMPMDTSFVFRADFVEDQIVVPYVKGGVDYVFFRQSLKGSVIKGVKYGMHGIAGIQILLDGIDSSTKLSMEEDYGINDMYFTLEARYNWINDFGGGGLNLSSWIFSFGLLFEY